VTFPPPAASLVRVSAATPFDRTCNDASAQSGTLYLDAEVEPYVAVNPASPLNVIGIWQQDRWSNGGAQGLMAAASFDDGATWTRRPLPTSQCAGGTSANGGDYQRASDPWVSFAPDGTAYAISLSFSGATFATGSTSAMLVTRSSDGGQSWSAPVTLIRDGSGVLNDKESITADPNDSAYVYAVWDRIDASGHGPAWFSRTTDGGASWETARSIYDPGVQAAGGNQTLGNQIVVLSNGTLLDLFTEIDYANGSPANAAFKVIRSTDHGATWSAPVQVAPETAIGATDPETGQTIRDGAGLADVAVGPGDVVYAVWQDARFSGGARDGIALSRSTDGGATWSAPVEINGDPSVQAFTPSVRVLSNGTIAVTYYDLRSNTPDAGTLPADYWQTVSTDGATWHETRVSGPFDLDLAPDAEGLFLGDYQGLGDAGTDTLPFFVQTLTGATGPTDVFALPPPSATPLALALSRGYRARGPATARPSARFRSRVAAALRRLVLRHRVPGPGTHTP